MSIITRILCLTGILITLSLTSYPQSVIVGTGTAISVFSPLNRTNDYCVYEVIYPSSLIGLSGVISAIGFERWDGTNTDSIENVTIYLKHTSATQLSNGTYDTTGYTQVYSGSFPNTTGTGWMEVPLNGTFNYDGINNLQVLVSKGYQPAIANTPVTPRWLYTNISPSPARARRYYGNSAITATTALTTTQFTSNARLTFGTTGVSEIKSGQLSVYPIPSDEYVNFSIEAAGKNPELIIYNSTGQEVYRQLVTTGQTVKYKAVASGVYNYLITGNTPGEIMRGKFVIN